MAKFSKAEFSKERRQLLLSTAAFVGAAAAFALLGGTRPARAWTVYETPTTTGIGLAYANRCGGTGEHAGIVAQLQGKLANDPSAQSETANCPLCGCAVTVSR
jgi:hypothetical protein